MATVRQQYMPIPKEPKEIELNEPKEIELIPLNKNPLRRIFKCPESVPKLGKLETSPPKFVFGPIYRSPKSSASGRDDAWQKLLETKPKKHDKTIEIEPEKHEKTIETEPEKHDKTIEIEPEMHDKTIEIEPEKHDKTIVEPEKHDKTIETEPEKHDKTIETEPEKHAKTIEIYMSAMRRIEKEARATYGDGALDGLTESEFRWMMIKDGCFFLQLVLYILGASKQLGYPDNHLIFGKKQSKKTVQGWIKSMFLVGNQIPLVVLNELMKQSFFQMVIKDHGEWERPSDMLSKQILFELLVVPALECSNPETSSKLLKKLGRKTYLSDQEQPSDLLHGLQLFLLGPGGSRTGSTEYEREEELEDRDLKAGIEINNPMANNNLNGPGNGNKDDEKKQLCASDLQNKGIFIWNSKTAGSRGISFTNWIIFGSLSLPSLKVNHDTNVLFTNLKYYEITQQQKEVRSYLRFLSELISTYEDVNVLAKKGIIDASASEEKERFLEMLRTLADKETTHHHRYVIGRVKDYSVFPWERFKYVAILVFFLTIAQTVFGVLSYVIGVKQLHESRG